MWLLFKHINGSSTLINMDNIESMTQRPDSLDLYPVADPSTSGYRVPGQHMDKVIQALDSGVKVLNLDL